jgi:hypothetical protein
MPDKYEPTIRVPKQQDIVEGGPPLGIEQTAERAGERIEAHHPHRGDEDPLERNDGVDNRAVATFDGPQSSLPLAVIGIVDDCDKAPT